MKIKTPMKGPTLPKPKFICGHGGCIKVGNIDILKNKIIEETEMKITGGYLLKL